MTPLGSCLLVCILISDFAAVLRKDGMMRCSQQELGANPAFSSLRQVCQCSMSCVSRGVTAWAVADASSLIIVLHRPKPADDCIIRGQEVPRELEVYLNRTMFLLPGSINEKVRDNWKLHSRGQQYLAGPVPGNPSAHHPLSVSWICVGLPACLPGHLQPQCGSLARDYSVVSQTLVRCLYGGSFEL